MLHTIIDFFDYEMLKFLHVLGSTLLLGSTFMLFLFFLQARKNDGEPAVLLNYTQIQKSTIMWVFVPAFLVQVITGIVMAQIAGFEYEELWLTVALISVFFITCLVTYMVSLLPHVMDRIHQRKMAGNGGNSAEATTASSDDKGFNTVGMLNVVIVTILVIVLFHMVFKPELDF